MTGKTNYVLVGLFVLALTLTLIAGVLWLGSGGPGRVYDEYLLYMQESVSGLSRDNAVKYHGVDVGRVREIALDPRRAEEVRLLLEIDRGTPIREDTVATLETQGLTGLAYINLTGGAAAWPKPTPRWPGFRKRTMHSCSITSRPLISIRITPWPGRDWPTCVHSRPRWV